MRTLLLAERPFHGLRSRTLLMEIRRQLASGDPLLLATGAPSAPPGFLPVPRRPDPAALDVSRVVLTGVFQERERLEIALSVVADALAAGARLEVRGFSLERSAARSDAPNGAEVLDAAPWLEAREHHTADTLLLWRVAAPIRISAYPERFVPADPQLAQGLPNGPVLGLGILGDQPTRNSFEARQAALRKLLAPFLGWPVLPLPMEAPGSAADDWEGSSAFAQALLPGSPLLLPELGEPQWRRRHLTAGRLKALAAHCRFVVTNQDVPAVFAVAGGVPVIGIVLGSDRRIVPCLTTLANELPQGSDLVYLRPGS